MSIFNGGIFGSQSGGGSTDNPLKANNTIRLTFSGSSIIISGSSVVNGVAVNLSELSNSMTGNPAGWYYAMLNNAGDYSFGTPSVGVDIVANTQVYTPTPTYDTTKHGYYYTSLYRIVGIFYFNGTNILEAISYGNGSNKNDDFWHYTDDGVANSTNNGRLQLTGSAVRARGTNIICTDLGSGITDSDGFRITCNNSGILIASIPLALQSNAASSTEVVINKNNSFYKKVPSAVNNNIEAIQFPTNIIISAAVAQGDYFNFYFSVLSGSGQAFIAKGVEVVFKEYN